ncbi:MAG TPA: hypothetical protein VJ986_05190, partial [Gaiellaceae bacterium]|nr:hypothetical protein [Gaiellaceae bacterium]
DLRAANTLAVQAANSAAWVGSHNAKGCAQFGPAASKLAAASTAAQAIFQRYRQAKSRYGTQEEIRLVNTLKQALAEARGSLAKASGETATVSAAERRAATAEVGAFQQIVARYAEGRLGAAGLADVLTGKGFRTMKNSVVAKIQTKIRSRAEAELRRLTGLRIRLNVPLKQQIHDFMEAELSRLASRLAIAAGPAGIVISLVGARIVHVVGAALDRILKRGNVVGRANRSLRGLENLRRTLTALPPNAPVDKARAAIRNAERELGRTSFLEADLKRTGRTALLAELTAAKTALTRWVFLSKHRFLVDSDLLRENFAADAALAAAAGTDAERFATKLGCTITTTPAPPSTGGPGKPPTAAVCVPGSIRMEYSTMFGVKLGEYDASFQELVTRNEYAAKCLWVAGGGPTDEAFVVFIDFVPDGVQGALPSGACTGRQDSPPFYYSHKRYLTVSGGPRKYYQAAVAGNETILKGVLAAAEAAGVGKACK